MNEMVAGCTLSIQRIVRGERCLSTIDEPDEKLVWRGRLPGASTYDRAAHVLRGLQADGVAAIDLLPLALPASWMVNSKASSIAMQAWQAQPALDAWAVLLELIGFSLAPAEWLALDPELRGTVAVMIDVLATRKNGATLAAVSKVLALLRPQIVPLMDDAALAYALDLVPEPTTADAPAAPASAFVPMVDWFAEQSIRAEKELVAIAVRHELAVLDGAQVLDRLLWVESWGHRDRDRARQR